jgi:hypothetical protein
MIETNLVGWHSRKLVLLRAKKWDIKFLSVLKNSCSSSFIVISFDTIPADSLQHLFYTPIFLFQMPSFLIKVYFYWNFALNKYSLGALLTITIIPYNLQ